MNAADAALGAAFRDEWARLVAAMVRRVGDLSLAEDAAQDAFAAAAASWPEHGVPENPGGWLMVAAGRKAIDRLRRERNRAGRDAAYAAGITPSGEDDDDDGMTDDRLRLLFLCAHPALGPEARIALTLRCVAGLTTAAIARAFLVPEPTMAQRLVRAKARIRATGIAFRMPGPEQLSARLESVLGVIYLIFNEGYLASSGDRVLQAELCDEAIRLGRLLREMVPGDVEVTGLLALMLLHHARTPARTSDGAMVPLDRQQRALWNRAAIDEGQALLASAFEARRPGPYQVQAAIAALHAQAATVETTDWPRIATLYGVLAALTPSPVVELNRAVAVAMADGPAAGLVVLAPLLASRTLRGYAPLHAAHADLLRRSGDIAGAAGAYRRAIAATANEAQRDELKRRLRDLNV